MRAQLSEEEMEERHTKAMEEEFGTKYTVDLPAVPHSCLVTTRGGECLCVDPCRLCVLAARSHASALTAGSAHAPAHAPPTAPLTPVPSRHPPRVRSAKSCDQCTRHKAGYNFPPEGDGPTNTPVPWKTDGSLYQCGWCQTGCFTGDEDGPALGGQECTVWSFSPHRCTE